MGRNIVEQEAYDLGKARAEAEATWYFDGNSDEATVRRFLQGIRDGDPEIGDQIGRAPLSGEFADDYSLGDLERDFQENDQDVLAEIAQAYEDGYWETIEPAVEREATTWLGEGVR